MEETLLGILPILCCAFSYGEAVAFVADKAIATNDFGVEKNDSLLTTLDTFLAKSKHVQKNLMKKIGAMEETLGRIHAIEESIPKLAEDLKMFRKKEEMGAEKSGVILTKINEWLDFVEETLRSKPFQMVEDKILGGRFKRSSRKKRKRAKKTRLFNQFIGAGSNADDYGDPSDLDGYFDGDDGYGGGGRGTGGYGGAGFGGAGGGGGGFGGAGGGSYGGFGGNYDYGGFGGGGGGGGSDGFGGGYGSIVQTKRKRRRKTSS